MVVTMPGGLPFLASASSTISAVSLFVFRSDLCFVSSLSASILGVIHYLMESVRCAAEVSSIHA